jgi:hypothetical protein
MKRILLASVLGIAASVAMVASSQAQGHIRFDNYVYPGEPVRYGNLPPPGYNPGDVVMDTSVVIGLYAGAGLLTDSSGLQLLRTTTILAEPLYNTGGWYFFGDVIVPTQIWPGPDSIVTFQVRGWNGMWDVTGASALWAETDGIVSVTTAPYPLTIGPMPLVLNVPEPSLFALAGLGATALCFFRRRA